jgi:hypothetical protein
VNLCVRRPLEVNGKGIRGVGEVTDKEVHTAHTKKKIIPIGSTLQLAVLVPMSIKSLDCT